MLIETINATFIETHLVEILLSTFGITLVGLAVELRCKVVKVNDKVDKVSDNVTGVQLDLAKNYRLKDDCSKTTECPQERKAGTTPQSKDLATEVNKINNDLAVLTSDIEDLRNITSGANLNKAIA